MCRIGSENEKIPVQLNLTSGISRVHCGISLGDNYVNLGFFIPNNSSPIVNVPKLLDWTFHVVGLKEGSEAPDCSGTVSIKSLLTMALVYVV